MLILIYQVSTPAEVYMYLGCAFVLGLSQRIPELRRERRHPLIFSQ